MFRSPNVGPEGREAVSYNFKIDPAEVDEQGRQRYLMTPTGDDDIREREPFHEHFITHADWRERF